MNWPNLISLGRLLAVPVTIWLILSHHMMGAFILFCVASISDFLDGLLARVLKARTTIGAYLDPLADKVLLVGVFVTLASKDIVPLWLVILVVSRDILIVAGSLLILLFEKPFNVEPLFISKVNTTVQMILVVVLLGGLAFNLIFPVVLEGLFWLTGITTFLSGAGYMKLWIKKMGES